MPVRSFAFLSGAFGATASCLAKLAFSTDTFLTRWMQQSCNSLGAQEQQCEILVYVVRGICFVGTLALNVFMVGSFLEGMEQSGSLAGTAISNGANFVVSSLFGFLLWEESFSLTWLFGFALVIAGTTMLSTVKAEEASPGGEEVKQD